MAVRLFVGNLSYEATEAELREHFGSIGQVTYCYLPTDRETGRPRGFAFVEFGDDSHAHQAIDRLNNQAFRGRPLAVKEAQPRESRPPGAGPRYGGAPGGGAPRPYSGGPSGPPRPYGGPPREGYGAGPGGPAPSRERNFGPDAPPKGKRKQSFNRKDQQGPRGPIRTKTDNRIYSAFGDDEEDDKSLPNDEFDDFASSLEPDQAASVEADKASSVEPDKPDEE